MKSPEAPDIHGSTALWPPTVMDPFINMQISGNVNMRRLTLKQAMEDLDAAGMPWRQ
jgi:hypothetical protein